MPIPVGINVSKAVLYGLLQSVAPTGINVSKANLYGLLQPKPGISVSKAVVFAVLGTPPVVITDVTVIVKGVKRVRAPQCDEFSAAPVKELPWWEQ